MSMEILIAGALHSGISLDDARIQSFRMYCDELSDWNSRINLTAITDAEDVQLKHFLDSLTIATVLPGDIPRGMKLLDVGSGGGFPGLPLKIVFPQIELTLLEATRKKAEFLKHMIERLSLDCTEIVPLRAEVAANQPEYREKFDCVVARGLAEMATLVELTMPFCKVGGCVIAQKKEDVCEELAAAKKAIHAMGGGETCVRPVDIPGLNDKRCLVVIEKVKNTPAAFPRRDGVPSKRPLV